MKTFKQAEHAMVDGRTTVVPAHVIEQVCMNCGFDVDEAELSADTCSDCGEALNLKRNIQIMVTSTPLSGATM